MTVYTVLRTVQMSQRLVSDTWKADVHSQRADCRLQNWKILAEFFGN